MKLVNFDKKRLTIEFSKDEFYDIVLSLSSAVQEYKALATTTLHVPRERLHAACVALSEISRTQSAQFDKDSAAN